MWGAQERKEKWGVSNSGGAGSGDQNIWGELVGDDFSKRGPQDWATGENESGWGDQAREKGKKGNESSREEWVKDSKRHFAPYQDN